MKKLYTNLLNNIAVSKPFISLMGETESRAALTSRDVTESDTIMFIHTVL